MAIFLGPLSMVNKWLLTCPDKDERQYQGLDGAFVNPQIHECVPHEWAEQMSTTKKGSGAIS
jgi:hypothetical protein